VTREAAESSAGPTANETAEPAVQLAGVTRDPVAAPDDAGAAIAEAAADTPAPVREIALDQEAPFWGDAGHLPEQPGDPTSDAWVAAVAPEAAAAPSPAVALEPPSASEIVAPPPPVAEPPPPLKPTLGLEDAPAILKLTGITRHRGDAAAIDGFGLDVRRGEVVALLGDNGSGKTTLVDILSGDDAADRGQILVGPSDGRRPPKRIRQGSPAAARRAGIGTVRRRAALAGSLTGLQNIAIGARSLFRPSIGRRALRNKMNDLKRRLDLHVDLDTPVAKLSGGERIQVELLKIAQQEFPILVLDEPSAALTPQECATLFKALRALAETGTTSVLTVRRPEDAVAAADRIVVLRNGRKVADLRRHQTDAATLTALVAGRAVAKVRPTPRSAEHPVVELSLVDAPTMSEDPPLHQVSVVVRAGEVIGVAGTPLNGQSTLVAVLSGLIAPTSGQVRLFGRNPRRSDPALFLRAGIGKAQADCRRDAFVPNMTVAENLVLERIGDARFTTQQGLLDERAIREHAARVNARHAIGCSDLDATIDTLSAARIRKLALGRMLDSKPHLIVVHDATRSLTLTERADLHRQLMHEREDGAAILMITDDLEELLTLSDYIGVLHRGRLSVPQPAGAFDRQMLGLMMGGHGSLAQDWSGWGGGV
jgi:general nucleoside transport system ATP-binding protein